jgi:hypothetical protein
MPSLWSPSSPGPFFLLLFLLSPPLLASIWCGTSAYGEQATAAEGQQAEAGRRSCCGLEVEDPCGGGGGGGAAKRRMRVEEEVLRVGEIPAGEGGAAAGG